MQEIFVKMPQLNYILNKYFMHICVYIIIIMQFVIYYVTYMSKTIYKIHYICSNYLIEVSMTE